MADPTDPRTVTMPPSAGRPETLTLPPVAVTKTVVQDGSRPVLPPVGPDVTVPGYEVQVELGRGAMGVVYRARQADLNRTVALKMVSAGGHASPTEFERFRREAVHVARLRHPNVVVLYEAGEHRGVPYFAMEFCAGGSLAARLGGNPLVPTAAAELLAKLAAGVAAIHAAGMVHRDLKPANVLFDEKNEPKVADFGLAKRLDAPDGPTRTGAVMGTPSYMAPEQARGARDVTPAADVYALGAILYECLTGRPPFKGASTADTLHQVQTQEPVSARALNPSLPRDLVTICHHCLQKDPGRRYPDAAGLAADLGRFLRNEPILARPVGPAERAWKWVRRNKVLAAGVGSTAAALVLGTAVSVWQAVEADAGRRQAEENLWLAQERDREMCRTVDKYYTAVSQDVLLDEPGMAPLRRQLLELAREFYANRLKEQPTDSRSRVEYLRTQVRHARLVGEVDSPEAALAALADADARAADLSREAPDDPAVRAELAEYWFAKSVLLRQSRRLVQAAAAAREAVRTAEGLLTESPAAAGVRINLAVSLRSLASSASEQGDHSEAERLTRRALAALPAPGADDRSDRERAVTLANMGMIQVRLGAVEAAEVTFAEAEPISRGLVRKQPRRAQYREDLARCLYNRGWFALERKDDGAAVRYLSEARRLQADLVNDHGTVASYRLALFRYTGQLTICQPGPGDDPRPDYQAEAGRLLADLERDFPHDPEVTLLSNLMRVQRGEAAARDPATRAGAAAEYRAAFDRLDDLRGRYPEVDEYRYQAATCSCKLGLTLHELGQTDPAQAALAKALGLAVEPLRRSPVARRWAVLAAVSWNDLGDLGRQTGRPVEVTELYTKAVEVLKACPGCAGDAKANEELRHAEDQLRTLNRQ